VALPIESSAQGNWLCDPTRQSLKADRIAIPARDSIVISAPAFPSQNG
jgi:hypothetical protein